MPTFRFRSNRSQARVRRLGHPDETRSFLTHYESWVEFHLHALQI
jgi:hypothetical protein